MSAWPQFVPRIELDVHLKSIDERFAELMQRMASQQEHQVQPHELDGIHDRCKELASKAELNHLGSRLDLQIACTDSSVVEDVQAVREYIATEINGLRESLQAQIDTMKVDLSTATQEIVRLDGALINASSVSEATFATKAELGSAQAALDSSRELSCAQLTSAITAIDADKASQAQLDAAKVALRSSDEALAKDLATTSASLAHTSESLVFLDKLCRETFVTKTALTEVSVSVADLAQRIAQTAADREGLQGQLDTVCERLCESNRKVQQCTRAVNDTCDDVHQLKLTRERLEERCDKSEEWLQILVRDEKMHWHEGQEAIAVQQRAHAKLQGFYEMLCQELQSSVEAGRQDREQLRQHSTIRYLDQLDKALGLQQTVEKVQQGHQELSESMRVLKLPKM